MYVFPGKKPSPFGACVSMRASKSMSVSMIGERGSMGVCADLSECEVVA